MIVAVIFAIALASAPTAKSLTLSFNGRVNGASADGSSEFPLTLSWGASSVSTYFKGPSIQVALASLHAGETPVLRVDLDGQFVKNARTPANTTDFTVDVSVDGELQQFSEHVLTVTKLVEPVQGEVAVLGITLPPEGRFLTSISDELHPLFRADLKEERRIEIIGASIQAGFGDLGNNATCTETPLEQDTTRASGGDVARYFGAKYNNIAFQGTGFVIGSASHPQIPVFYQRTIARDTTSQWDFKRDIPQVVIIEGGGNDWNVVRAADGSFLQFSNPNNATTTVPTWSERYTAFIKTIRSNYPEALLIFLAFPDDIGGSQRDSSAYLVDQGPGNQANENYQTALAQVLDAVIAAGDTRIVRLPIPASAVARAPGASQFGDDSGYGCNFHPNVATQANIATDIQEQIKASLGWMPA